MASVIKHFLLVYDHKSDELVRVVEFGEDVEQATEAYAKMEAEYSLDAAVDIVLVGSDSLETVKVTHRNYFTGMGKALISEALGRAQRQLDLA